MANCPLIVVSEIDVDSTSRLTTTYLVDVAVVVVGEATVVVVSSVLTSVAVVVASGVDVVITVVVTTGVV
jgi:hypothetical protein